MIAWPMHRPTPAGTACCLVHRYQRLSGPSPPLSFIMRHFSIKRYRLNLPWVFWSWGIWISFSSQSWRPTDVRKIFCFKWKRKPLNTSFIRGSQCGRISSSPAILILNTNVIILVHQWFPCSSVHQSTRSDPRWTGRCQYAAFCHSRDGVVLPVSPQLQGEELLLYRW